MTWKTVPKYKNYQINIKTLEVKSLPRQTSYMSRQHAIILKPNKIGKVYLYNEYATKAVTPQEILKMLKNNKEK